MNVVEHPDKPDDPPARPKKKWHGHPIWWVALVLALAAAILIFGGGWAVGRWEARPFGRERMVRVRIDRGTSLKTLAADLEAAGVIEDARLFALLAYLRGEGKTLQAGDYIFAAPLTPGEVLEDLRHGSFERRLVIPEGWTSARIAGRLTAQGWIEDEADWTRLTGAPLDAEFIGEAIDAGAEGFLFPDTYFLEEGMEAPAILDRMLAEFAEVWRDARPDRRDPRSESLTAFEAVTLASMIEREARAVREMPEIASVYLNRLARGMKLQCDATVRYGLGEVWDRPLTFADLKVDSPYNTYAIAGLPPGPIGNPGRRAIEAVLRPARSDYLYYVYRGDGSHEFTRTYAEHLKAARRFRESNPTAEHVAEPKPPPPGA